MSTETRLYYPHGTFSWVDLSTPDTDAAAHFYGSLFGWTHKQVGDGQHAYVMFYHGSKEVCGMAKAKGAHPHWLSYVSVENADDVVKHAQSLGGQVVMPPMDVMEAGRMAIVVDPTGASFGLWQPNKHSGAQLVNEVGSFCWNELLTSDPAKASTFYTQLFPWKPIVNDMNGMQYTMFETNGKNRSGMMAFTQSPPNWMVYFVVANYDEAEKKAVELGAKVMMPARDIPNIGKFGVIQDPQGAYLSIMQMAPKS